MLRRSSVNIANERLSELRATSSFQPSHRSNDRAATSTSKPALAAIQDVTEDWSYFENSYVLTKPPSPMYENDNPFEDGRDGGIVYEWNTSDYETPSVRSEEDASPTSEYGSEQDGEYDSGSIDMDTASFDNDATILAIPSFTDHLIATVDAIEHLTPPKSKTARVGLFDLALQEREIQGQATQVSVLEASITDSMRLLADNYALTALQKNLVTPIHGKIPQSITRLRFLEENLTLYNAATVTAKLDELQRIMDIIDQGCNQYDVLRNMLASEQWSEEQGLRYWDRVQETIACNKERSDADFLIWTIPFQIPAPPPANKKERRNRRARELLAIAMNQTNVPESHRNANSAAKQWRGHIGIKPDHLEMHIRVFGVKNLPELPKEVMRSINDEDVDSTMSPSICTPRESFTDESDLRSMRSVSTRGDLGSESSGMDGSLRDRDSVLPMQMRMVKSHSRKALQVLGIRTDSM